MKIFRAPPPRLLLLPCVFVFLFVFGVNSQTLPLGGTIVPDLEKLCKENSAERVNLMLDLPATGVEKYFVRTDDDAAGKLKQSLIESTEAVQRPLIEQLKKIDPDLQITPYWIANRIGIKNAKCSSLTSIAGIPLTAFVIRREEVVQLQSVGVPKIFSGTSTKSTSTLAVTPGKGVQWGVDKINATQVWPTTKGKGVTIAGIDSGVRGTHVALKDNYRSTFGWLDGFTNSSAGGPKDGNGHGTHTMGTIAGGMGVGVAPEATWIACKGCSDEGGCGEAALLTCGQWVLCPYTKNPDGGESQDCEARPRLVSNSWGGNGVSTFYNPVIEKWRLVGIVPIFAIGNSGPLCASTGSPGNQDDVISVGATDINDAVAEFSSRGPAINLNLLRLIKNKPEVSAPGKDILSTWITDDNSYASLSGTSMATPHVAGATALLFAKNPNLKYEDVVKALEDTAVRPKPANPLERLACRTAVAEWPNNAYGYGRINVLAAFNSL